MGEEQVCVDVMRARIYAHRYMQAESAFSVRIVAQEMLGFVLMSCRRHVSVSIIGFV